MANMKGRMELRIQQQRTTCLGLVVLMLLICSGQAMALTRVMAPANFSYKTDQMGFRWDVNQQGMINDGTSDCFDGALRLNINGTQFNCSAPKMMPDGEFILTQMVKNVEVTRRIKVHLKDSVVRYVESFRNPGRATMSVNVVLHTYLGGNGQALISDRAVPVARQLTKKEYGMVAIQTQGSSRPSVIFLVGNPRAKIKPTIVNQSNRQFTLTWNLKLLPGKTVSISHAIGQRRFVALPDAKSLATLFKPLKSRKFLKDVPTQVRRTIINSGGGVYIDDERGGLWSMPGQLQVEQERLDVLAIGEGTRLKGQVTCEEILIRSRYGEKIIPIEQVAGIAGRKYRGQTPRVFLRDGQVLSGELQTKNLRFTMNSGLAMKLTPNTLDRLVMRIEPGDAKPQPGVTAYVETFDGDRLALAVETDLTLSVVTPWGARGVPVGDMIQIRMGVDDQPGYQVSLRDGTRFVGFLGGNDFETKTLLYGPQKFSPAELRAVITVHGLDEEESKQDSIDKPHVVMTSGHVLIGRVDLPQLHLIAHGETIPLVPSQAKSMQNVSDDSVDSSNPMTFFSAELWGGGTVKGQIKEVVLPIRIGENVMQVPVRDISEIVVPSPVVPDALRTKIAQLIRDLGHPKWSEREKANAAIAQLGHLALSALREAVAQTRDHEIKRRAQALLDALE